MALWVLVSKVLVDDQKMIKVALCGICVAGSGGVVHALCRCGELIWPRKIQLSAFLLLKEGLHVFGGLMYSGTF